MHRASSQSPTHLIPDQGLFDGSQILQRRKEHVTMFWPSYVLNEVSQLFCESREHLVFVFYGV
jgi:hypothetical protein